MPIIPSGFQLEDVGLDQIPLAQQKQPPAQFDPIYNAIARALAEMGALDKGMSRLPQSLTRTESYYPDVEGSFEGIDEKLAEEHLSGVIPGPDPYIPPEMMPTEDEQQEVIRRLLEGRGV